MHMLSSDTRPAQGPSQASVSPPVRMGGHGPCLDACTVTDALPGPGRIRASPRQSNPLQAPGTRRDAGRGSRSLGNILGHLSPPPT